MSTRWIVLSAGLAAGLLAGCTVGPDYTPPSGALPARFAASEGSLSTGADAARPEAPATQPGEDLARWWDLLGDDVLSDLIAEASASNLDVAEARARVLEARALRGVAASRRYPDLESAAAYDHRRSSANRASNMPGDRDVDDFLFGFDSTWEIDLFGGVRRSVEAADAELAAGVESLRDVQVSLSAEVARNYVALRQAQQELRITRENLALQRETLDLTRARYAAGLSSDLDVARAEAQVATTQALQAPLEIAARQAIHRLGVLSGRDPAALLERLSTAAPIPRASELATTGVPSDLLRRRPDIRLAERRLAAATARVGVATADLFPRFTLTGSYGLQSERFADLGSSGSMFWSIGPGMRWPIFNAGRLRSAVEAEEARTRQALAAYERTVLRSLEEVENALVSLQQEQQRVAHLRASVDANRRAVDLSRQLHVVGLVDFLNVLEAQRSLLASEDALIRSEAGVSGAAIALYKALGGGWSPPTLTALR